MKNWRYSFLFCAAIFLLLPPSPGWAESGEVWTLFSKRESVDLLFYDPSSVVQLPGHIVKVNIKEISGDGTVAKVIQELKCNERVVRDLEPVPGEKNRTFGMRAFPSPWRGFERAPDSGEFYRGLCKGIPVRPR